MIIRFVITFALAMLFGLDRQKSHKPISFGAYSYVATGSCGLAIAALELNSENPLPLLSAIVTGIGFLGAGALLKTNDRISGFTTASGIWVFAIFGLLIGLGYYKIGIAVYLIIWLVVLIDKYLENRGIGSYQRKLIIKTNKIISDKVIKDVLMLNNIKFKIISVLLEKTTKSQTMHFIIEGKKPDINKLPSAFNKTEWLDHCKIE